LEETHSHPELPIFLLAQILGVIIGLSLWDELLALQVAWSGKN